MYNQSRSGNRTSLENLHNHVKEGYSYIDTKNPNEWSVPPIEQVAPMDKNPYESLPNGTKSESRPMTMSLNDKFKQAQQYAAADKADNSKQCTPVTNLLLPETSTMVYTDEFFEQPNSRLFLQTIGPNEYSYSVDTTPINSLA